jgi:hypothetical protein
VQTTTVQTTSDEERRRIRPGEPECTHNYPIVVTKTQTGCYARCLKCLGEGPERPFSEAARFALVAGERRRGTRPRNHLGSGVRARREPHEHPATLKPLLL